jgi:hypothetical protein
MNEQPESIANTQSSKPSDKHLAHIFATTTGGPNPFYICSICGHKEVGLREYLVAHLETHIQ